MKKHARTLPRALRHGALLALALLAGSAIAPRGAEAAVVVRARVAKPRVVVVKPAAPVRVVVKTTAPRVEKVWVPGHWVKKPGRARIWVPGHWKRV